MKHSFERLTSNSAIASQAQTHAFRAVTHSLKSTTVIAQLCYSNLLLRNGKLVVRTHLKSRNIFSCARDPAATSHCSYRTIFFDNTRTDALKRAIQRTRYYFCEAIMHPPIQSIRSNASLISITFRVSHEHRRMSILIIATHS